MQTFLKYKTLLLPFGTKFNHFDFSNRMECRTVFIHIHEYVTINEEKDSEFLVNSIDKIFGQRGKIPRDFRNDYTHNVKMGLGFGVVGGSIVFFVCVLKTKLVFCSACLVYESAYIFSLLIEQKMACFATFYCVLCAVCCVYCVLSLVCHQMLFNINIHECHCNAHCILPGVIYTIHEIPKSEQMLKCSVE